MSMCIRTMTTYAFRHAGKAHGLPVAGSGTITWVRLMKYASSNDYPPSSPHQSMPPCKVLCGRPIAVMSAVMPAGNNDLLKCHTHMPSTPFCVGNKYCLNLQCRHDPLDRLGMPGKGIPSLLAGLMKAHVLFTTTQEGEVTPHSADSANNHAPFCTRSNPRTCY